ncbi:MAG: CAP domain-containing protein [Actinobacteria bacterium]|nr:CAP domain-containing protein [Actinomycetota bacterium]
MFVPINDGGGKRQGKGGPSVKLIALALISAFVAVFTLVGVASADPEAAQVVGGGYVKKCGGGEIFLNQQEKRIFVLHNEIRREHDLQPFCVHPELERAARAHSRDMMERDYFTHENMGGGTFDTRLGRYGYSLEDYRLCLVGENIAYGNGLYGEPKNRMHAWMKSEGHRHNILNGKFREIGVGTYVGTYGDAERVTMYTADFGARLR